MRSRPNTETTTLRDSHPIADVFPMMTALELQSLADDIREQGLLTPIVLHQDGRILDGRNRAAACMAAGVEPRYTTFDANDVAAIKFVAGQNLHRRHLSEEQRAFIAARLADMTHGGQRRSDSKRPMALLNAKPLITIAKAAETMGVSSAAVDRARTIQTHAPELESAVVSGDMSLRAADDVASERRRHKREREQQSAPSARAERKTRQETNPLRRAMHDAEPWLEDAMRWRRKWAHLQLSEMFDALMIIAEQIRMYR